MKRSYKKKYKRRYKNKSYRSTWAGNSIGLAKQALKTAKWVAGLINAEAKDYYVNQTSFNTGNAGSVVTLNGGIIQGVGDGQRTGDSIKIKTLTVRGDLTRDQVDDVVRVIVVWDKENTTTISNLLEYVGTSQVVNSPKEDDTYYKSKFILDRRYVIDSNNPKRLFKFVVPVNQHVKYNNATNTIENGNLKIFFYSQIGAYAGTACEFISKVTFMDN